MGTRGFIAALFAAISTVLFVQPAPAGTVTDVKSAISFAVDGDELSGWVTSKEPDCEWRRTVRVLIQQKGRDQKLATTGSDVEGKWSVNVGSLRDGTRLRAKLKEGFTPDFTCLNAVSPARVYRKHGS